MNFEKEIDFDAIKDVHYRKFDDTYEHLCNFACKCSACMQREEDNYKSTYDGELN